MCFIRQIWSRGLGVSLKLDVSPLKKLLSGIHRNLDNLYRAEANILVVEGIV